MIMFIMGRGLNAGHVFVNIFLSTSQPLIILFLAKISRSTAWEKDF